jgi:hypothetical protein
MGPFFSRRRAHFDMCFVSGCGCILIRMRALVVICAIAGCGDSGLLLDITPGASDATTVEVFLPSDQNDGHIGLPGAQQKTPATVYTVADHVTAAVTGGHARILLQPGSLTSVPAMLVLAYDGSHAAVAYAVVTDPSGSITFRHTQSDELKIELSPITEVPTAGATMVPVSAPRLARWTAPPAMPDDPNGACIAVLHDDGHGGIASDYFAPEDDQDCDAAEPECDDNWYLRPAVAPANPANPQCARDDRTPATMDACRIGDTVACTDNIGDCKPREPAICAPSPLCDKCNDQLDPQCAVDAFADTRTLRVECTFPVQSSTGSAGPTFCQATPVGNYAIDLAPRMGTTFSCSGATSFYQPPLMPLGSDALTLMGTSTATVAVACSGGTRGLLFTLTATDGTMIDPTTPATRALISVGVASANVTRTLVLPFVARLVPDCAVMPHCELIEGIDNGQPFVDPLWKCAGGQ